MAVLRAWGVACFLVAAALWLTPGQARAFPEEPCSLDEGKKAHTQRFHILGEVAMFAGKLEGDQRSIVVSPIVEMRLQLTYDLLFQAKWGFSYVNVDREGDETEPQNAFRSGNPYVALHYQGKKNQFSYRIGAGVAIPVATVTRDLNEVFTQQSAYNLAAAVRGNNDFWLWDPHTVSVIVPIAFERRKPSGFLWGAYLDTGALIKIDERSSRNQKTDFIMQMAAMMGYQATDWLRVGSRFSLVLIPKYAPANTQLAVEPYLRFGGENGFGVVRVNINLDNPNGFSFDARQVWGLRIGGGAAF